MEDTGLRHRQAGGGDSKSKTAVSSPKGSSGIATTVDEKFNALLSWDSLPAWRQDNAFIHSGYRRIHPSYWHQVLSLAHLHNESVNIWSHLLGGAGAVAASVYAYTIVRPRYESANSADVLAIGSFFTGAVLCLGMSATFHALLSHSENVARWGNKLDYSGIVALIVGSYMPALYYGFFCKPFLMRSYMALVSSSPLPPISSSSKGTPSVGSRD